VNPIATIAIIASEYMFAFLRVFYEKIVPGIGKFSDSDYESAYTVVLPGLLSRSALVFSAALYNLDNKYKTS